MAEQKDATYENIIFEYQQQHYKVDLDNGFDISIPLQEGDENPNCYYAENVHFETINGESFIGSVAEGGSVNYQKITLTPHGNGTHTECYGHISSDKNATIHHCLNKSWFLAELVTLSPRKSGEDELVLLEDLKLILDGRQPEALVIRTMPNSTSKLKKKYSGTNPPYLEGGIGTFLADSNIKHLLIDLPSVDREMDNGILLVHKEFWRYPHQIRKDCTITELIFVDDHIKDGTYLLNLQTFNICLDASPSRPVLYSLEK